MVWQSWFVVKLIFLGNYQNSSIKRKLINGLPDFFMVRNQPLLLNSSSFQQNQGKIIGLTQL